MTTIHVSHRSSDRRLAARWDQLAVQAREAARGRSAAELTEALDAVATELRAGRPVSARGAERAAAMLRTARSALDRRTGGGEDVVAAAAREALAALREPA